MFYLFAIIHELWERIELTWRGRTDRTDSIGGFIAAGLVIDWFNLDWFGRGGNLRRGPRRPWRRQNCQRMLLKRIKASSSSSLFVPSSTLSITYRNSKNTHTKRSNQCKLENKWVTGDTCKSAASVAPGVAGCRPPSGVSAPELASRINSIMIAIVFARLSISFLITPGRSLLFCG